MGLLCVVCVREQEIVSFEMLHFSFDIFPFV